MPAALGSRLLPRSALSTHLTRCPAWGNIWGCTEPTKQSWGCGLHALRPSAPCAPAPDAHSRGVVALPRAHEWLRGQPGPQVPSSPGPLAAHQAQAFPALRYIKPLCPFQILLLPTCPAVRWESTGRLPQSCATGRSFPAAVGPALFLLINSILP